MNWTLPIVTRLGGYILFSAVNIRCRLAARELNRE